MDKRRKLDKMNSPSYDYIEYICSLYGDSYDDRDEDSRLGGTDWKPGEKAHHLSLEQFRKELDSNYGIQLSTAKIRKVLITGGRWTTERSREVVELYERYKSISRVAERLSVSEALIKMYLPYEKVVYDLVEKSSNAKRIAKCRKKKDNVSQILSIKNPNWRELLWKKLIEMQGIMFTTSGRGNNPGVEFSYEVRKISSISGKRYKGESIDGYSNELWVVKKSGEKKKKSISRSTVELAYERMSEQEITGPRSLGIPGAGSYLFVIINSIIMV